MFSSVVECTTDTMNISKDNNASIIISGDKSPAYPSPSLNSQAEYPACKSERLDKIIKNI